jgi:hypothetical protein
MTIGIDIVSEYKDKGAKLADSSLNKLTKGARNLALAMGVALSVNKIVAFGRASVKEFSDAEKASASLRNTLKNTGSLMAFPDTEAGLKNLSKLSGIADDSLIPSFTQLYRITGSASQAMSSLNLAIDVSRGSSNDLNSVVDALSKGYAGNTKALGNLELGLNRAFLKSADMVEITAELNKSFSGASAAYLDTYAGKVELLNNKWNDTKQIVGQGLVMAFQEATGNRGVGGMTDAMEKFGYIVDAILIKTGILINTLTNNIPFISDLLKRVTDGWAYILDVKGTELAIQNEIWKSNTKTYEMAQKTAEEQAKRNKEYLAFLAKQKKMTDAAALAAKKKAAEEAALKKYQSMFDIDKIQIIAALQRSITDDEKLRLQLQLAILQENGSEAERLAKQLAISQLQTTNLALAISKIPRALNPFEGWGSEIDNLLAKLIEMYRLLQMKPPTPQGTIKAQVTPQNAASVLANAPVSLSEYQSITSVMGDVGVKTPTLNITINNAGNVVSDADLVDQIRNGLLNQNLSGSPSAVGRLLGAFQ